MNFTFGEHRFADCRQREVDKHASECPKAAVAARAGVARATVADTPAEPGAAAGSAGAGDCIPGASYRAVAPPMYNYGGFPACGSRLNRFASGFVGPAACGDGILVQQVANQWSSSVSRVRGVSSIVLCI